MDQSSVVISHSAKMVVIPLKSLFAGYELHLSIKPRGSDEESSLSPATEESLPMEVDEEDQEPMDVDTEDLEPMDTD